MEEEEVQPIEEPIVEESQVDESIEEQSVEEPPIEEPVDEQPIEEPIEEQPLEEEPIEEEPVEESSPVEEPAEEVANEEAPIDDENVMRATEFASLIHSKKPSNTNSLRPQQNAQKSDNMFGYESVPTVKGLEKDSHEKEKWGPSLFNFDDDSAFSVQPKRKTITPPDGYIFQDDINQPAIWQKERYGKGINLSDN